jgi:hypothetical protein
VGGTPGAGAPEPTELAATTLFDRRHARCYAEAGRQRLPDLAVPRDLSGHE